MSASIELEKEVFEDCSTLERALFRKNPVIRYLFVETDPKSIIFLVICDNNHLYAAKWEDQIEGHSSVHLHRITSTQIHTHLHYLLVTEKYATLFSNRFRKKLSELGDLRQFQDLKNW